jgi:hypothetical protein
MDRVAMSVGAAYGLHCTSGDSEPNTEPKPALASTGLIPGPLDCVNTLKFGDQLQLF